MPTDATSWFRNIIVVWLDTYGQRVIGTAWSLSVELIYYVAMALFLARYRRLAYFFFVASGVKIFIGYDFEQIDPQVDRLFSFGFYFSLGIVGYFHRAQIVPKLKNYILPLICVAVFWHYFIPFIAWPPFYYPLGVVVCLPVILLCSLDRSKNGSLDDVLGRLSYPVFLMQSAVLYALKQVIFEEPEGAEHIVFLGLALGISALIAYGFHRGVELPIEKYRKKIRPQKAPSPGEPVSSVS